MSGVSNTKIVCYRTNCRQSQLIHSQRKYIMEKKKINKKLYVVFYVRIAVSGTNSSFNLKLYILQYPVFLFKLAQFFFCSNFFFDSSLVWLNDNNFIRNAFSCVQRQYIGKRSFTTGDREIFTGSVLLGWFSREGMLRFLTCY